MATIEWENIGKHQNPQESRAKVFGGWLVRVGYQDAGFSLTFVPDPKHEWE